MIVTVTERGRWLVGPPVITATLVAGVLCVDTAPAGRPWLMPVLGSLLALSTVLALWCRSADGLRIVLFVDVLYLGALAGGIRVWPVVIVAAVAIGWLAGRWMPAVRPGLPWLRRGRLTSELPWLAGAVVIVSPLVLVWWARLTRPSVSTYLGALGHLPTWELVIGIVLFGGVNAAAEEGMFRGELQTGLARTVGTVPAIITQGIAFGIAHLHGFPSGPVGACLSGCLGLALGVLRARSGGILAAYLTHAVVDSAIGVLAITPLVSER